jgi:hypothetical protein
VELTSFEEAQDLALAAHKYQMEPLLETSVSSMSTLMSPEHVWATLELANLLNQNKLKEACIKVFYIYFLINICICNYTHFFLHLQVMQTDTTKCIAAKNFLQISEENMALLLTQDMLNVENELVLIDAAVSWAQHEAQRRGLAGDDTGVRAVLEPRLLSLLRLLTLTPEQFISGPGKKLWLTGDEKWAVTSCQHDNVTTMLPKHLSKSFELRKNCSLLNYNRIFINARPTLSQSSMKNCCYQWSNTTIPCLHADGLFRVTENCKLLGVVLPSQCMVDPTVLSPKKHFYNEHITVKVYCCGASLSNTDDSFCKELRLKKHTKMTLYNSTITILFDSPVQLASDEWFIIKCHFMPSPCVGKYPNAKLANRGYSNGIEFIFHTEQLAGNYHKSVNDGLIRSLLLSPL